jgi:hypothetical protein
MIEAQTSIFTVNLALYEKLIATSSQVERKGKTTPYTSLNGHMFSFLTKDGTLGLRLANEDREEFILKFETQLMEQHGRIMKEYVVVPNDLFEGIPSLSDYFQKSMDYILTLKPKPTKRKPK